MPLHRLGDVFGSRSVLEHLSNATMFLLSLYYNGPVATHLSLPCGAKWHNKLNRIHLRSHCSWSQPCWWGPSLMGPGLRVWLSLRLVWLQSVYPSLSYNHWRTANKKCWKVQVRRWVLDQSASFSFETKISHWYQHTSDAPCQALQWVRSWLHAYDWNSTDSCELKGLQARISDEWPYFALLKNI